MATMEQQIYQALAKAGLSQNQAAGVMGNIQNESDFNVESAAMDSNGAMSYGMIQWNAASYPNAGSLVTGNSTRDLANQVNFLLHNTAGTGQGLQGSSAAQVAGNWANFVEICQGCTPGGAQNVQRQQNATNILGQIQSGNWGAGGPGVSGSGGTNATTAGFNPFNPFNLFGNPLSSLGSDVASGISQGLIGAFVGTTNAFLQKLGIDGWKDFFIRLSLILLGATILIIGLTHLTDKNTQISLPSSTASGGEGGGTADETPETATPLSRSSAHSSPDGSRHPKTTAGGGRVKTGASSAGTKLGSNASKLAKVAAVA